MGDPTPPSPEPCRPVVLFVDDDVGLRGRCVLGLQERGFKVVSAGSAEEALRVASSLDEPVDVVVMDLVLPDSWGAQLAAERRAVHPETKVIFISSYVEGDAILEATASGEDVHFLHKPFTVDELAGLIRHVLNGPPGPGPGS